jgi:hypothetical protein
MPANGTRTSQNPDAGMMTTPVMVTAKSAHRRNSGSGRARALDPVHGSSKDDKSEAGEEEPKRRLRSAGHGTLMTPAHDGS